MTIEIDGRGEAVDNEVASSSPGTAEPPQDTIQPPPSTSPNHTTRDGCSASLFGASCNADAERSSTLSE